MPDPRADVQWEYMAPAEFRRAQEKLPVCLLPLGTVEWHGEHNCLGLDALKAHALCCRALRLAGGGVVHPPVYGGMGGLDKPATVKMEGEASWDNHLLRPWLEKLLAEIHRQGFAAIIVLTGHYGHNQQIVVRETAARMSERLGIPILGIPEYFLALDVGYLGDHAGIGETSLMMALHPETVEIDRIDGDADYGTTDKIKNGASVALGEQYAGIIVERLVALANAMPGWDEVQLAAFVHAERAVVSAQVKGWRCTHPWAAWQKIKSNQLTGYGAAIAAGDFAAIKEWAGQLLDA